MAHDESVKPNPIVREGLCSLPHHSTETNRSHGVKTGWHLSPTYPFQVRHSSNQLSGGFPIAYTQELPDHSKKYCWMETILQQRRDLWSYKYGFLFEKVYANSTAKGQSRALGARVPPLDTNKLGDLRQVGYNADRLFMMHPG